jgi:hypothetical protein
VKSVNVKAKVMAGKKKREGTNSVDLAIEVKNRKTGAEDWRTRLKKWDIELNNQRSSAAELLENGPLGFVGRLANRAGMLSTSDRNKRAVRSGIKAAKIKKSRKSKGKK